MLPCSQMESALGEFLQCSLPELKAFAFPSPNSEEESSVSVAGKIKYGWLRARSFEYVSATLPRIVRATLVFHVSLEIKDQRSHRQGSEALEKIIYLASGFQPFREFQPFNLLSGGFIGKDARTGFWLYSAQFTTAFQFTEGRIQQLTPVNQE